GQHREALRRERKPADEFRLYPGQPRRHRGRAPDVPVADLRLAARLQSRRYVRRKTSDHRNRDVPQRALPMMLKNGAMTFALLIARTRRPIRRFLRDKRGISAVEFAMLL